MESKTVVLVTVKKGQQENTKMLYAAMPNKKEIKIKYLIAIVHSPQHFIAKGFQECISFESN